MIAGSVSPWIECILLAHAANTVTTMDWNLPTYDGSNIQFVSHTEMIKSKAKSYDAIFSFSSIEVTNQIYFCFELSSFFVSMMVWVDMETL